MSNILLITMLSRYALRDSHRAKVLYQQAMDDVRVKLELLNTKHGLIHIFTCVQCLVPIFSCVSYNGSFLINNKDSCALNKILIGYSLPWHAVTDMCDQLQRYIVALAQYYGACATTMQDAERVCFVLNFILSSANRFSVECLFYDICVSFGA